MKITSDTVMNSFMIPALGGQIYAMAGMTSRLHLIADEPGQFTGRNTMYSGDGFADQHFQAHAMTNEDFDAWTEKVRQSPNALNKAAYDVLVNRALHIRLSTTPVTMTGCLSKSWPNMHSDRTTPQ